MNCCRELNPELLAKKDRGKGVDMMLRPSAYGQSQVCRWCRSLLHLGSHECVSGMLQCLLCARIAHICPGWGSLPLVHPKVGSFMAESSP